MLHNSKIESHGQADRKTALKTSRSNLNNEIKLWKAWCAVGKGFDLTAKYIVSFQISSNKLKHYDQ